jgi:recombination protein RecT
MPNELQIIEKQLFNLKPMFDQVLRPTGLTAERMMRTVVISCERNPRLLQCTPTSILQSAMTGAVLGLEADGYTGQGFLVPFNLKGTLTAQWITGYKGQSTLGWRAGLTIMGEVVREGDEFEYELGSAPYVRHKPLLSGHAGRRITHAWATATAPNRVPVVVVMPFDEILEIKEKAPGAKKPDSPWSIPGVPFAAMCAKTARRRLGRSLPLSSFVLAARIDEAHEEQGKHAYLDPNKGMVIEGIAEPLAEGGAPPATGPRVEQLDRPTFLIQGIRGTIACNSIEEWRASMTNTIVNVRRLENLDRFRDLNNPFIEDYSHAHPAEVRDVVEAFERRRTQI